MECQECGKKATETLHLRVNHAEHTVNLCSNCYSKGIHNPMSLKIVQEYTDYQSPLNNFRKRESNKLFQPFSNTTTKTNSKESYIDEIADNLNKKAKEGKIDPVIGRDKEIVRIIEILNRRKKNNPVLIGEPGVGKTAIAEALALKIEETKNGVENDFKIPNKLLEKEIYSLNVSSLTNGTKYRGELEAKLEKVAKDILERENIILFIDEIHLLVGAGSSEGSPIDVANFLKPYLSKGEIQVVGATTLKEYKNVEKDAALERRLQPIIVQEPTIEDTIKILEGIKHKYEDFHNVSYSEEVIQNCVSLSSRYIQDRFLPDKAIDLLDESGSKINLMQDLNEQQKKITLELEKVKQEKEKAKLEDNFEYAAQLRDKEVALTEEKRKQKTVRSEVKVSLIQKIIEEKTGVPVQELEIEEKTKMKKLEENLSKKVIGQTEAVSKVSKAIKRSRAGLKTKNRPIGSFLFVGPTGVGKTELSKVLAQEIFGTKDSMIRLDMSEYMEKHSVSKIIGSPPGYVGYKEAGQLTEKVRRNPYSIILLDEIEKAHPEVQHLFLQILEDGRLTDSQGRVVNFKETVIIMTSNAGTGKKSNKLGFGSSDIDKEINILDNLGAYFKPEFLNRFDSIIEFGQLKEEDLVKIVDILVVELQENLTELGIELILTQPAKRKIAKLGYHPTFGARPLRRVIQEQLEDNIAEFLYDNENVSKIKVSVNKDEIVIEK